MGKGHQGSQVESCLDLVDQGGKGSQQNGKPHRRGTVKSFPNVEDQTIAIGQILSIAEGDIGIVYHAQAGSFEIQKSQSCRDQ